MGTPAGFTMFTNVRVNAQIKKMLDVWAAFLTSPESCYVLNSSDSGWFGPQAQARMPDFIQTFICNPEEEYWGFTSWDKFFTRFFRPDVRKVYLPDDNRIVNSACESTVYNIARGVKERDSFWLKGQPYSLLHMLNNDEFAPQFIGGTVFQAFLSVFSYHRWHSPINGRIVKTVLVPGTYYAEALSMGFDPSGPNLSQAFVTAVATRALIFIESPNPSIGLMCFIAVGMSEVSSCELSVWPGDIVKKGDELGTFHLGGSTYCLVFRPETDINFDDYPVNTPVKLNAMLGTVTDK